MRRPATLLASCVLIGLVAGSNVGAVTAQESTPSAADGPAIVGVWENVAPESTDLVVFHSDGSFVTWVHNVGMAIGVWEMTGERTLDLWFVFQDTDPAQDVWGPGTATFTVAIELDETGDAYTGDGSFDLRDADGNDIVTDLPYSVVGTRMTIDTNPSSASPAGSPAAGSPAMSPAPASSPAP